MNLYKKKRFWATILVVQIVLYYILSKINGVILIVDHFFEYQKWLHQKLFSFLSTSIGDLFYILLIAYLLYLFIKSFQKKNRHQSVLKLLITLNVFYFLYQLFWGMLYFQKPLTKLLPQSDISLQKRKELAEKYLNECKKTRLLVAENKDGVFVIKNQQEIYTSLLEQQNKIPTLFKTKKSTNILSMKASLFSDFMSYTGILGYYNPFTAEAQYNKYLPSTMIPFTLCHESAHQLGFAREQEANFIGYLIGIKSTNIELKYSTQYFTLKSLLNSIVLEDKEFVDQLLKEYSDGMKRDRAFEKHFIYSHQGKLEELFSYTNDLFLKSNQQEGSITYSYFVELLVQYEDYLK